MILFYREDQSVAEVAGALVLSEDAVKQRLSRGRGMLREQVAELVESGSAAQPAGTPVHADRHGRAGRARGRRAKTALAGRRRRCRAPGRRRREPPVRAARSAGLMGTLGGLLGGWLGTWVPAQAAPTRRERDAILRAGRRMLLVSVVFSRRLVRVDSRDSRGRSAT